MEGNQGKLSGPPITWAFHGSAAYTFDPPTHLMKQFLIPAASLFACTGANAQITIVSTDMAIVGDVITRYRDTIPNYGPGSSGAGQSWDFSMAQQGGAETTSVIDPSSTPYGDSFGGSDLAMTNDNATYLYFSNSAAIMTVEGTAGDPLGNGTIITAQFNPSLTLHEFPRQFSDGFTSTYASEVIADGSSFGVYQVRLRHHGIMRDTTDSYGEITTPVGTYESLRVKNTAISVDSIWTKLLSFLPWTFVQAAVDTTVSYSWLAKETKLPVAEMTVDSLGAAVSFTYSAIAPLSTGLFSNSPAAPTVMLYPQPATDQVRVQLVDQRSEDVTSVNIVDADGRIVKHFAKIPADGWLDVCDLAAGTFVVGIEGLNRAATTARLLVVR